MIKKISFFVLLLLFYSGIVHSQEIRQVWSEVKDDKVVVHYKIDGAGFVDRFTISLFVSRDGGITFEGPLKEVSGDVGREMARGDHSITWDALKEKPFVEESLVFDVRGEKQPAKKSFFISYVGNPVTWMGLRAGMVGKVGFYAEFRANTDAFYQSTCTYKDGYIADYSPSGYYQFTGRNGYSAFSLVGGINWQVAPDLFVFGGVGLGREEWLVQIDQFHNNSTTPYGQTYAKYDGYCASGLEIDAGAMYRVKWFLVSAGLTTINFRSFNWTAGVGVTF